MKFTKAGICLSIILALSACSEKETAESYLIKAKHYTQENKINEAVIELKNSIRADVNNGEARFLLGKIYLNQGNGTDAVKELERARKSKHINKHLIPLLARAYLLTDSDDEVIALSDDAKSLKEETLSRYLAYKTLAALRSEQVALAQTSAKQAMSSNPDEFYSKLAETYLVFSENNLERASILAKSLLAISAENPDALMLQGQIATAMKDYEQAAKSFQLYLSAQPKSGIVQLLLAHSLLKSEQYVKAELYADTILAQLSTQPFANYIKAMVRFQSKDYEKASEHAEAALSANFKQVDLKLVAGASAFYLKNWEQTNHHLSAISKYLPPEHQAKKMLVLSQLELGLINDISDTLNGFSANNDSDSQFIASLSYKLLELGAVNEAKQLVDKNESVDSDAGQSARQGMLKLMMNDPSGMQDLENAIKLNPKFVEAEFALAYASVQVGNIEQAKKIADKWKTQYPDKAGSSNLMAIIHIKEKEYIKAEQALDQSLSKEKDNAFALIELVNVARYQDKIELAKERANHLIEVYPDSDKAQRLYFGLNRNEKALEMIISSHKQDKLNIKKALLASEALVSLKKIDNALEILKSIQQEQKLPKRYWQLLLAVYKMQQNENQIIATLEQWREASPYHIEASVLLVDFYANKKDYSRALSVVNRAFEHHEYNLTLQLVKMHLLLSSKELYQAKALYKTIAKRDIKKPLKMGLEGRIFLLEKKFEQAIPKLDNFYQAYPSAQNAMYLASAYQGNSNESSAIEVLESFLVNNEKNDRVRAILAGMYIINDKNKAIESYVKIAESQPNSVVVLNNLAWLYMEKGELDKALRYSEKAVLLAPKVASVLDTRGMVLLKSGSEVDAWKMIYKAFNISQGADNNISLNYAEALIANNQFEDAITFLGSLSLHNKELLERKVQLKALAKEKLAH
ncbi:XrtA/PEP-CTERM system TPR-repeat protein PrsT [Candidatus Colwellia aromaticivorans]|uniref:XrtA/PEP-CTERM system TPR-repeat protein PrsT n=1 Tax=Candidatus Colwellia aromaticivorans TaxID=2267621 RepID=UPI000DF496F1|nr:XrtA/PEP-CTERM system TPR-repeat protein PrsT [Candidatus Colwellia aromaticivorans]